jgi:hypothetical protein
MSGASLAADGCGRETFRRHRAHTFTTRHALPCRATGHRRVCAPYSRRRGRSRVERASYSPFEAIDESLVRLVAWVVLTRICKRTKGLGAFVAGTLCWSQSGVDFSPSFPERHFEERRYAQIILRPIDRIAVPGSAPGEINEPPFYVVTNRHEKEQGQIAWERQVRRHPTGVDVVRVNVVQKFFSALRFRRYKIDELLGIGDSRTFTQEEGCGPRSCRRYIRAPGTRSRLPQFNPVGEVGAQGRTVQYPTCHRSACPPASGGKAH